MCDHFQGVFLSHGAESVEGVSGLPWVIQNHHSVGSIAARRSVCRHSRVLIPSQPAGAEVRDSPVVGRWGMESRPKDLWETVSSLES